MNAIRSHKHQIYNETVNKVALSGDDDKRYILGDIILTLVHGYKILMNTYMIIHKISS